MPSYTTNYSIPKPTNNGDATTWGTYLNSGMDIIDGQLLTATTTATNALPKAGGTLTGGLTGTTAAFSSSLSASGTLTAGLGIVLGGNVLGASSSFSYNIAGGNSSNNGGAIALYGSSAAGVPGSIIFNAGTGGTNATVGSFNGTTGLFTVNNNVTVGGTVTAQGNIVGATGVDATTVVGPGFGVRIRQASGATPAILQFTDNTVSAQRGVISADTSGNITIAPNSTATFVTGSLTASSGISGTTGTFSGAVSGASAAGSMLAASSDVDTGTSTTKVTTPAAVAGSAGHAKAWVQFGGRGTNGACTINKSFNVASVSRVAAGSYTITFTNALADANYVPNVTCQGGGGVFNLGMVEQGAVITTTTLTVGFSTASNTRTDPPLCFVTVFD